MVHATMHGLALDCMATSLVACDDAWSDRWLNAMIKTLATMHAMMHDHHLLAWPATYLQKFAFIRVRCAGGVLSLLLGPALVLPD